MSTPDYKLVTDAEASFITTELLEDEGSGRRPRRRMRPLTVVLAYSATLVTVQLIFISLRNRLRGVDYYRLVRVHQLVTFEFVMCIGSFFLWTRLCMASAKMCFPECLNESGTVPLIGRGLRWRRICMNDVFRAIVGLFLLLSHLSFMCYYVWIGREPHALALASLTAVGFYLHLLCFIAAVEFAYWSSTFVLRKLKGFSKSLFSRPCHFIVDHRDSITMCALVTAIVVVIGGLMTAIADPIITPAVVHIKDMPANAHPVRIALLTDVHIGPTVGKKRVERIVKLTNSIHPDIIAISGDLADGFLANLKEAATPLCDLQAKSGVFFATGNHEYMHGNVEEWFEFLRACNITVLHNSNKRLENVARNEGLKICMSGVDDLFAVKAHVPGHGMDPVKALSGCQPEDIRVLLAHQPNAAAAVLRAHLDVHLILSGHTHAGQFYMFAPIVYAVNAFTRGLYHNLDTETFVMVSAGVNFFGPPIKMLGTCEIVDLQLVSRQNQDVLSH